MRPYLLADWRRARRFQLTVEPLCRTCLAEKRVSPATVVDHVIPLALRPDLFLEPSNLQSLCKRHHDSHKQQQEKNGFHEHVDRDGYPTDPRHPANRHGGESLSSIARSGD